MRFIIGAVIIAAIGISAGWWTTTQVSDAGTTAVSVGTEVAGVVGDAITKANTEQAPPAQ